LKKENLIKSCFVFGNGPSLGKDIEDKISYLSDQAVFVVNHFSQSNLYETLKPTYYVIADEAFWESENLTNEDIKLKIKNTLISIKDKTTWPLIFLTPVDALRKFTNYFSSNSNIRVIDYNKISAEGFNFFKNWSYKHNLAAPSAQTVLNAAIFNAISIGFKEINILGADHSWHKNFFLRNDNVLCIIDDHFYDKDNPPLVPLIGPNIGDKPPKVHEELYTVAKALEIHHQINNYAKSVKVNIFNRSSITFVDAYERKSF